MYIYTTWIHVCFFVSYSISVHECARADTHTQSLCSCRQCGVLLYPHVVGCEAVEDTGDLHTVSVTLVTCYDDKLLTIFDIISTSHHFGWEGFGWPL